jgi:hypothetical protein
LAKIFFPFDEGAGANVTEFQWQKMAQHWLKTGVITGVLNNLQVFADSTGMQVKTKSGAVWIKGHYFESDVEETLAIGTADPSNPRIDRVIIRLDWTANTIDLAVIQGTPAASPELPVITQNSSRWEIPLAQIRVNAGVTTIVAGDVTDDRDFSDIFDRLQFKDSYRDGISFAFEESLTTGNFNINTYNPDGSYRNNVFQVDINGIVRLQQQSFVHAETNSTLSVSDNVATKISNLNTETLDKQNEFSSSRFTAKGAGIYLIRGFIEWATAPTGRNFLRLYKNGAVSDIIIDKTQSGERYLFGSIIVSLNAADYLEFYVLHDDSGTNSITLNRVGIQLTKLS